MKSALRPLFLASAVLLALLTLARVFVGWCNATDLTPTSGTFTALAVDLKHGVFYRPLYGDLGYGGTRYFPLHFVLHAALLELGMGPEAAGHFLEAVAAFALLFGMYRILCQLNVDRMLAGCISVLLLAPETSQLAILAIRGDLLPAALNILGVSICMTPSFTRRHLLGASLLFTLAFSAKMTTLFGVAAVFLFFALSGRIRKALEIVLVTGLGCAGVIAIMLLASGGRVLTVLRACAAAAGYNPSLGIVHLALFPGIWLPVGLPFIILGCAALFALPRRRLTSVPAILFVLTALATAILLGAIGTTFNHFIDLHVAALIVFAAWLCDGETTQRDFGMAVLCFAALFSLSPLAWKLRHEDSVPYSQAYRQALQFIGKQDKPILADNPLIPVLGGQQPYVLDLFMFNALAEKTPSFAQPMADAIRQRQFAAVILEDDLESKTSAWRGAETKEIEQNYELVQRFPKAYVYLPRKFLGTDGRPQASGDSASH